MIAFSPGVSWLIFGAVIAAAIGIYFAVSAWIDRRDAWIGDLIRSAHSETWIDPRDAHLRITGGVYDWEKRGEL